MDKKCSSPYDVTLITRYPPYNSIIRYTSKEVMRRYKEASEIPFAALNEKQIMALTMLDAALPEGGGSNDMGVVAYVYVAGVGDVEVNANGFIEYALHDEYDTVRTGRDDLPKVHDGHE